MTDENRIYLSIDLKSFYASVECVARGLNPLNTNLVVADGSRTNRTICLAVSPSLKAYGIGGRARLFEVVQRVREINRERRMRCAIPPTGKKSVFDDELKAHPDWEVDYLVAPPRMSHYIKVSSQIYKIYLRYIAPEDIHVYSIDEVMMDVTSYLKTYKMTAHELAIKMIHDVLKDTGITATAGIGSNLYLSKVAMDIMAKKMEADADGVRIAELDEMTYRRSLWNHKPLTDFWRVGHGIAQRLAPFGIDTMGKIARYSRSHEEMFYHLFGVNAELLIDHAWGWEPCTIEAIKAYRPESNSLSSGQVLTAPYTAAKARVVIQEMADNMALKLVRKRLVTNQLVLNIGYDVTSISDPAIRVKYDGPIATDHYGRQVPKPVHGSSNLPRPSASTKLIREMTAQLFDRIVNPDLLIRRMNLTVNNVVREDSLDTSARPEQMDMFTDYEALAEQRRQTEAALSKERRIQEAQLAIKQKFGKNAILTGLNFVDGATARERNRQIGGHKE